MKTKNNPDHLVTRGQHIDAVTLVREASKLINDDLLVLLESVDNSELGIEEEKTLISKIVEASVFLDKAVEALSKNIREIQV